MLKNNIISKNNIKGPKQSRKYEDACMCMIILVHDINIVMIANISWLKHFFSNIAT